MSFEYGNERFSGIVNRITKRATVLLRDPGGLLFSDGNRYETYYIPLSELEPVSDIPGNCYQEEITLRSSISAPAPTPGRLLTLDEIH